MKKQPEVVYQYLKYETFEKMIEKKTLRLCNIRNSNDTTELDLVSNVIKSVLWEEFRKARGRHDYFKDAVSEENFGAFLDANTIYLEGIEKTLHSQFVTCFSERKDLLSMWRGYAEDHRENAKSKGGIAVGFNIDALKEMTTVSKTSGELFSFEKVRYALRNQKALFRSRVKNEIEKIRLFVKGQKTVQGYDALPFQLWYQEEMIRYGALVKNSFFFEEHEWRLSHWGGTGFLVEKYNPHGMMFSDEEWITEVRKIKEKEEANVKKAIETDGSLPEGATYPPKFFDLDMSTRINDFISEIVIGPKCSIKQEEIESMIAKNGITCKVELSRGYNVFVDSANHGKAK